MMGINLTNNDGLFENYGTINIKSNYILFVRNRMIYEGGNNNAYIFYNKKTLNIGTTETKALIISNNKIESNKMSSLFNNYEESTLNLNGKSIIIDNNAIILTSYFDISLFDNKGSAIIGSGLTEILRIDNNEIKSKDSTLLLNNTYGNSSLEINGKSIIIVKNAITSTGNNAHLLNNVGTTVVGTKITETLNISDNRIMGHDETSLFKNESKLNLDAKSIAIDNNIVN